VESRLGREDGDGYCGEGEWCLPLGWEMPKWQRGKEKGKAKMARGLGVVGSMPVRGTTGGGENEGGLFRT
jgi:hypothetical protein